MAYQLGMALKEFLILTQQDKLGFDEFRDHTHKASEYFKNPDRSIVNLFALIRELTREDASKRMSITQMQQLISFRNHPTPIFYQEIEKVLPASSLGIQKEVDEITELLQSKLKGLDLVKKANLIFNKLNESDTPEPRLIYLAEQLAAKSFKEGSNTYFANLSNSIEQSLFDKDWDLAPWYRKIAHVVSFGYFRVARQSSIESIKVDLDFKGEEFKTHFSQLEYIAHSEFKVFGKTQASNFIDFIFNNLEKIRSEEADKKAKEAEAAAAAKKAQEPNMLNDLDDTPSPEELDSGTIVITKNDSEQEPDKKPSKKLDKKAEVAEKPAKEDKPDAADNKHAFFTKANKRTIFKTYRTTMFRGDGTLPAHKHEQTRPSVKEVFEPISAPPSI